jgi:hypothetical protein
VGKNSQNTGYTSTILKRNTWLLPIATGSTASESTSAKAAKTTAAKASATTG